MNESEKTAVIIVNFNGDKYLDRCLSSLTAQTVQPGKIILVDNGSKDGSGEKAAINHPEIIYLKQESNIGFSAANNLGFHSAKDCEWIALLNPDAFPEPAWLEKLLEAAKNNPDYSFFGSLMLKAEEPETLDGTGDIYHVSGLAWRRHHEAPTDSTSPVQGEIFSPCAAAALYRRDALEEVGGFDELFFCYFEDIDLGFRLRLVGHHCLFVPDAVVLHVGSGITGKHSDFYIYHAHRNLVWTYFKNMPSLLFWYYLPLHLLMNLITLLRFILRGHIKVIFKAKWDALKGLPRLMTERKRIQSGRKISSMALRKVMKRGLLLRRY